MALGLLFRQWRKKTKKARRCEPDNKLLTKTKKPYYETNSSRIAYVLTFSAGRL